MESSRQRLYFVVWAAAEIFIRDYMGGSNEINCLSVNLDGITQTVCELQVLYSE